MTIWPIVMRTLIAACAVMSLLVSSSFGQQSATPEAMESVGWVEPFARPNTCGQGLATVIEFVAPIAPGEAARLAGRIPEPLLRLQALEQVARKLIEAERPGP